MERPSEAHGQDLGPEPSAVAGGAGHVEVLEEEHFEFFVAGPLAPIAAARLDVEGEMPRPEAQSARRRQDAKSSRTAQ